MQNYYTVILYIVITTTLTSCLMILKLTFLLPFLEIHTKHLIFIIIKQSVVSVG